MAAAAGYKLRARNMTGMGVQVFGTVLNKNVSTGDNLWGIQNFLQVSRCTESGIFYLDTSITS